MGFVWGSPDKFKQRTLPRSESRTVCPHCERPPGGVHALDCPRSRLNAARRKALAEEQEKQDDGAAG